MSATRHQRSHERLTRLARAATPWGFPAIYLGWAFLFWWPIVISETSVWSFPNAVLFLVGGLSPMLAGLGLAWLTQGRAGLRELGRRTVAIRRIGPRWWLILLAFWPTFNLLMAATARAWGIEAAPLEVIATDRPFNPVAMAPIVAFAFVFPAVEEIGLRGYWLDQLQARFSALVAGLINGITWASWHAPFVLFTGYYANTTFEPDLAWWMPLLVLEAVILVWVYNHTHRSILAVLCFHGFGNLTGELMGFTPAMYPFVLSGYVVVAAALVAIWSPGSLRGWYALPPRPADEP